METVPTTAFVLSGGASLGAVQAGMLQALYERNLAPDLILGASVGALNGAYIASRPPTVETARELGEIWRGVGRQQVFPLNPLIGFVGFFGLRDHLIGDGGLRRLVETYTEFDRLEDAPIPFEVITTDLLSGRELCLAEGPAIDAILASAAIPGVLPPVERQGRKLIDGGISNNTPIADAIERGAERVYVLPTGNACDLPDPPRGALGMVLHAMSLLIMRRLLVEIELLADRAELIVLPPPCPLSVSPIDFSQADQLIIRSHDDSARYLDAFDAGQAPAPLRMSMHEHRDPGRIRVLG
jgi:NTE family protein